MRAWLWAVMLVAVPLGASAAEVGGITVDERVRVAGSELELNGAALRRKLFFKIYVAGLYLAEKETSTADVLALAGPKRVSITLMRDLPAQDLVDALDKGIRENTTPAEQRQLKSRMAELTATLLSFQQGKERDLIAFDWVPDAGTVVLVNGEAKGEPIPGEDFYRAFLRVWVGDRPASAGLKRALLGGAN